MTSTHAAATSSGDPRLRELVELLLRDGHLYGARPGTASRTITVAGRRRQRVRLQADIAGAVYGQPCVYYPDLELAIAELVAELRP